MSVIDLIGINPSIQSVTIREPYMKKLVITGLCATMLVACGQSTPKTPTAAAVEEAVTQTQEEIIGTLGVDVANFDKSVRPQDNFYQYVNGTWLNNQVIPGDQTAVGAFYTLRENAREDVLNIIEELAKKDNLKVGSDEQKVADLYRSFMNEESIEKQGLAPLKTELAAIEAISDQTSLLQYFATSQVNGVSTPLQFYINVDGKVATEYRVHFWQGGISLPDRDYYFNEEERFADIRKAYVAHVEKMFTLAGFEQPQRGAEKVMAIETTMASNQWTKVQTRDSEKRYNKFAIADLNQVSDKINWQAFLNAYGVSDVKQVIINQPSFAKGFGEMISATSLPDWKIYLRWKLLNSRATQLTAAVDLEHFEFFSKTLNGQTEQRPRWKRGVDTVSNALGEVIGKVYVGRHFKPQAKTKMVTLVENLRKAYGKSIDELEWMSIPTKLAAKEKLASFDPKIGYPDVWKDYSTLTISSTNLIANLINASTSQHKLDIKKLGGPIDKKEWAMTPQTVNAYYNPSKNEIVFPAAILQPPFFNMQADDAVNYGGIGAVIGHEMGHGFDDQGSKYDGEGNLRNWWSESDLSEFASRTKALVTQYSDYQVFDDLKVNGELTLGENIGDLAGLTIAYKAYKLSLDGKEAPMISGYTGDQRFFLGFAQIWQGKMKEKALRNRVATDSHSPGKFRALGALSNMPEFYQAFSVKEGDKMYIAPEKRVKIW
ncbi:MAG: putative endopeptidase [Alteromonadaceae bacterium]|jgi:putative endopeptidase